MPRTSDKRERLITAGRELIHSKGFNRTTLADIAEASGVPLGNVYYYFRTKEALLDAVVSAQKDDFRERVAAFEKHGSPRARLQAFLNSVIDSKEEIARYGCPIGSLSQEMNKSSGLSRAGASEGLILRAQWASEQFRALSRSDAQDLGVWLIASIQGVILMANAMADPGVIERQLGQLKAWIDAF
ncbi:MAG: TetR/AcrR family transcriptional regulator [Betaproteobacteria bacterium]|nr:MAG: TetR/AcrR family transcriptional regulator [Betaproteobacteria bacterium]